MPTPEVIRFRDISLNFKPNPLTGDVSVVTNENAVKQSVRSIVRTSIGERFFSDLGSKVGDLLFENFTPIVRNEIKETISYAIVKHEPRCIITKIDVQDNDQSNEVRVTVFFITNNADETENVSVILKKVK